jgi:tetratricopeptide (TPR) repeat protein
MTKKKPSTQNASAAARGPSQEEITRSPTFRWLWPGLICLFLALATLAVYVRAARNDFVNYDDSDYVTENIHVNSGLKWANVVWAFKSGHASNWHPLTWLSHIADCQVFGMRAGAMHLVSVGFHVVNTLLLFLVLRGMTGAMWRSALVAALFALHPLHVESVAWVSERKDVLSAFFFLLTIGAWARYARGKSKIQNPKSKIRSPKIAADATRSATCADAAWTGFQLPSSILYLLALLFFALGLMSKPMLVTTPFVLLLIDYWPLNRLRLATLKTERATALRLVLEKVPFFALSVASSVITFLVQRKGGAVSTALTFGERIANALVSYARYLEKMFWPDDLAVLYPHPGHWPFWEVLACGGLLLIVCVVVVILGRRRPYLIMGWFWFLGTMVPVIGLVQVGIQSMADRYTYVPLIGLFIMVAWGINDLLAERLPTAWRAAVFGLGAAMALVGCAWVSARQIGFWKNSENLFQRTVRVTRNNYLAHNNLGFYFSGKGRIAEAMEQYRLSLKINPAYEDALNNLGYALAGQRKFAEAIPLYEAALRIRPKHAEVHNNLGNALSETGKIDDAIQHYLIALKQNPEHADAHNNLGIALAMKGKLDEAIDHFHAAIRYKPNYASAHSNLGNALAVQHKLDEAIKEFQESLRLKPDEAQAHNNLGNALVEQGRVEEAIGHYREALRLNPDNNPEAHYNLGLTLASKGKREEARSHFTEALRLKPDYTEAKHQIELLAAPPRN